MRYYMVVLCLLLSYTCVRAEYAPLVIKVGPGTQDSAKAREAFEAAGQPDGVTQQDVDNLARAAKMSGITGDNVYEQLYTQFNHNLSRGCKGWTDTDVSRLYALAQDAQQAYAQAPSKNRMTGENSGLNTGLCVWLSVSKDDKEFVHRMMFIHTGLVNKYAKGSPLKPGQTRYVERLYNSQYLPTIHNYCVNIGEDTPAQHMSIGRMLVAAGLKVKEVVGLANTK